MNQDDPYQELELYLERANKEITQVFENDEANSNLVHEDAYAKDFDYELDPFLEEFDATLRTELSELLCRYFDKQLNLANCSDEEFSENFENSRWNSVIEEANGVNAATQTSPSLSPTSTNLTWASECSSSPCLTCVSDDVFEDGSIQWPQQVLSTKSSSAPVLKKVSIKVNKHSRSQSDRHLAEIEAAEACKWLRATGFPQYAQMYEDMQFPIDVSTVSQDHPLLEVDVLHSLFRRLQTLNNCVHLHQQKMGHFTTDESEDDCCALSDNWTYQTDIRRWSRACKGQLCTASEKEQSSEKEDVFEQITESPKERLRRAGSTKFRRRRDGIFISDSGSPLLDSFTQPAELTPPVNINHISDSECTPRHRRSRTKSFDTTEPWISQPTDDRVVWHALSKNYEETSETTTDMENGGPPIYSLSCTQLQVLRKLALLKLTAHMEKYCPSHRTGWNWDLPKFIRKMKNPAYKDKLVFGVPLSVMYQRTGQAIPKNLEEAMLWLYQNSADNVGLFRKSGVKSRIQALRNMVDNASEILSYNDYQSYDVADMVKQYFRDLPETLLTNKLSETFILVFQYVPPFLRRESMLCAILLMPEEHVEVLQFLLHFLLLIAEHSTTNQMNENNLALCFAPTLLHYSISFKQNLGAPHAKELAEARAGHDCLLYLLKHQKSLFKIPKEFINQCKTSEFRESKAVKLNELGKNLGGWKKYLEECQTALLREVTERGRGWIVVSSHCAKVEVSYKKVADGHPLRLWKATAEVDATPPDVVERIIRERHIWDSDLHSARIVSQLDNNCEIFQYVRRRIQPLPNEEYCVLRTWRTDLSKDAALIVETSVDHKDAAIIPNTIRGIVLASRYFIEPTGLKRSKIIHLSRVDTMGRTPEWYQKNYGHICSLFLSNILISFSHTDTKI